MRRQTTELRGETPIDRIRSIFVWQTFKGLFIKKRPEKKDFIEQDVSSSVMDDRRSEKDTSVLIQRTTFE